MENIKEVIIKLLKSVKREGIDDLIKALEKSDFFRAPASTRFHLSEVGGLAKHSLNVYECLKAKKESPMWKDVLSKYSEETFILVSLCHDLCKVNFYKESTKNQKTYDPKKVAKANSYQVKHDSNGDFIWETVPCYEVDDKLPLGHGEKTVIMLNAFVKTTIEETFAIRWHMGYTEDVSQYKYLDRAFEMYPLALALFEADIEATKLLEKEE